MKLKEAIRRAVETNDVIMFGQVLDQLRSVGFSYNRSCDFAQKNIPDFNEEDFENWCYYVDSLDS